jgi:hypothetical protein
MGKYIFIVLCVMGLTVLSAQERELKGIKLTTDRTINTTSNEAIIKQIISPAMTPQQKAICIWDFFIKRGMHKEIARLTDYGNPAELMTKTSYGLCGNWGNYYAHLATAAGLTASTAHLKGHVVAAVKYWGKWHMYDADMWAIYPDTDGIVASPHEIRRDKNKDGTWKFREGPPVKSYPWYIGPDTLKGLSGLYGNSSINRPYTKKAWKWKYDLKLRLGMDLVLSWYPDPDIGFVSLSHIPGVRNPRKPKKLKDYLEDDYDYYHKKAGKPKYSWGTRRGGLFPNPLQSWYGTGGNGRLTCDAGKGGFAFAKSMSSQWNNLKVENGNLTLEDPIEKPLPEKGLKIELSKDGRSFRQVYPKGGVDDGKRIRLFDLVRGVQGFQLKVTLEKGSAPLSRFKAVGVFRHSYSALPALLKGKNTVTLGIKNKEALDNTPLFATYVYDQVEDDRKVYRKQTTLSFKPDRLSYPVDTGNRHWPLMREIRLKCGGDKPKDPGPVLEKEEFNWGAYPWPWGYWRVNYWNDFERGDFQGWRAKLTTKKTYAGSDFALDNNLMRKDGTRQLKMIFYMGILSRDTKFRCQLYVKNVKSLRFYCRNQADKKYPEKTYTDLKDGQWQTFTSSFKDLAYPDGRKLTGKEFMFGVYMVVTPKEGCTTKDVEFYVDNFISYDGELKHDPFKDPNAHLRALAEDPVWNARPPAAVSTKSQ